MMSFSYSSVGLDYVSNHSFVDLEDSEVTLSDRPLGAPIQPVEGALADSV